MCDLLQRARFPLKGFDVDDVAAGRRYLAAYVSFFTTDGMLAGYWPLT